jgi:hypothetical protein
MFARGLGAVLGLHDSCSSDEGQATGYSRAATLQAVSLFLEKASKSGWKHFLAPSVR